MVKKAFLFLGIGIILTVGSLQAQLSGSYTIGGTSGARNFDSWADFVNSWDKNGASAAVNVQILANETVSKTVVIAQHGSSPTRKTARLTINGNGKKLTGNFNREVLHLKGMDHAVIRGLIIENTATSSALIGIRFSNRADSNVLDSCTVMFSKLSTAGKDTGAYIAFAIDSGRITKNIIRHSGIGNTIKNGNYYSVLPQSPGPFYGIYDRQGSTDFGTVSTHNRIDSNTISTFYAVGICMQYINGERCNRNVVTRVNCNTSSATDTTVIGIFCFNGRSDAVEISISNNTISHIPYKNAPLSSADDYVYRLYGINVWKLIGGSKKIVRIDGNTVKDLLYYKFFSGVLAQYSEQVSVSRNRFYDVEGDRGDAYGIYSQNGDDVKIEENSFRKLDLGSANTGDGTLIYCNEMESGTWGKNTIIDNSLDSNKVGDRLFAIAIMSKGNWEVARNRIVCNTAADAQGATIGIYFFYVGNMDLHNNVIAQNHGPAQTYCIFSTNYNASQNLNIYHNTLSDSTHTSMTGHTTAMLYLDDDSRTEIIGNVIEGEGVGDIYAFFLNTFSTLGNIKHNSIYLSGYFTEYWAYETTQFSSFKDWNATGPQDSLSFWIPAQFAKKEKLDFRSREYKNQNNVPSTTFSVRDINKKLRHTRATDRGAFIDSMNIGIRLGKTVPDTVCSGYELAKSLNIINGYVDTITDIEVRIEYDALQLTQKRRLRILSKDTGIFLLKDPILLNKWGENKIRIFLTSSNDNSSDDTLNYTVFVKPAPGGGILRPDLDSSVTNVPILGVNGDVALVNREIAYRLTAPRGYSNADYGKSNKWVAETQAYTQSGKQINGAALIAPNSSSDLKWKFSTSDTALENSNVVIKLRIIDLVGGCDTILSRNVFIEPAPIVSFTSNLRVCNKDTLYVKNLSGLRVGNSYLRYFWDFGNADTSIDYEPYVVYPDTGSFTVRLTVLTAPYNYKFTAEQKVRVNPTPIISFSKGNACEGQNFVMENTSASKNANFIWNFGDGSAELSSNKAQVSHRYPLRGNYDVKLSASELGCNSSLTSRVSVFEQPKASFEFDTVACEGAIIQFTSKTQMTTAIFGGRWNFDESGAFSTQKNTSYTYRNFGLKRVSYTVKSEFGCIDSVFKTLRIKKSPKVDFTFDRLCKYQATKFENTTAAVSGTLRQLAWTLNGINKGQSNSLSSNWSDTGIQFMKLRVALDNGCQDSITKSIRILNQAVLDFSYNILCSGDSVTLTNKSEPLKDVSFIWSWGDGRNSGNTNVRLVFEATDSMSFPVLLQSSGANMCPSELIQNVPVLPKPKTCDYTYEPDYSHAFYGAALYPKDAIGSLGGQAGIRYTWDIENLGKFYTNGTAGTLKHAFDTDGTYRVKMTARTLAHSCFCEKEYTVVMDRLHLRGSDLNVSIFPNPLNVEVLQISGTKEMRSARLVAVNGQVWTLEPQQEASNTFSCKIPSVAAGMYELEWLSESRTQHVRIVVSNR